MCRSHLSCSLLWRDVSFDLEVLLEKVMLQGIQRKTLYLTELSRLMLRSSRSRVLYKGKRAKRQQDGQRQ